MLHKIDDRDQYIFNQYIKNVHRLYANNEVAIRNRDVLTSDLFSMWWCVDIFKTMDVCVHLSIRALK